MQAANRIELFIDLPLEVAGLVVGKKGATIKKIKETSRANVVLSAEPLADNEKCKRLTIQGTKREVEFAQDQVLKLLTLWCGVGSEPSPETQRNMDLLPSATRNIVLAFKGNRAQNGHPAASNVAKHAPHSSSQASNQHSASNAAPPRGSVPQPKFQENPVHPRHEEGRNAIPSTQGYPATVSSATMNGQLERPRPIEQPRIDVPQPLVPTEVQLRAEIEIPRPCISYIVGRNYENIAQLEQTSKAQIFPVESTPADTPGMIRIAFVGSEQAIFTARAMLMQAVNEWTSRVQHCMQAFQQPPGQGNPAIQMPNPSLQLPMPHHVPLHSSHPPPLAVGRGLGSAPQPSNVQPQSIPSVSSGPPPHPVMNPQMEAPQPQQAVVHQKQPHQNQPTDPSLSGARQPQDGPHGRQTSSTRPERATPPASASSKPSAAGSGERGDRGAVSRLELTIPSAAAGMIVGKKGAQIKRFKQECNVRVLINKDEDSEDSQSKLVVLEGPGPALDKGLLMMCETLALWAENSNQDGMHRQADYWMKELKSQAQVSVKANPVQQPSAGPKPGRVQKAIVSDDSNDSIVKVELKVPMDAVPWVVGKQGKTITLFKKETGCNIAFAHDHAPRDASRKILTLQGTAQQCNAARARIVDFLANSKMAMATPNADETDPRAVIQARIEWLNERIEEYVPPPPRASDHANHDGHPANSRVQSQSSAQTLSVAPGRIEMHITKASAAMIIGKKGVMHKNLQAKTGATISVEQDALPDGRKRLVIEGSEECVQKARRLVDDILRQCDDNKYEETERKKQAEDEEKRRQEETLRRNKKEEIARRHAQELAEREAVEKELAKRLEDERRWKEKQEKAAREAEQKRLFAEKVASNPFAFLDAEDGGEEEPEESPQPSPAVVKESNSSKKKKKKTKGGDGAAAPSASQGNQVADTAARDEADKADSDEVNADESELADDLGVESQHTSHSPGDAGTLVGEEGANSSQGCVTLRAGLLSRKGADHANEDRALICDLTDLLSPQLKDSFLQRSLSKKMPVFAVFDGHGGDGAAEFAKDKLLNNIAQALEESELSGAAAISEAMTKGFERTEDQLKAHCDASGDRSGTCAVCVIVWEEGGSYTLHVANLGDCRAMVGRRDEMNKITSIKVTEDHRAVFNEERKRIEAAGGKVEERRALGDLIPSRTLGDFKTKAKCPGAVIAVPQISTFELTPADRFLVLASDGLWDDLKVAQVMEIMSKDKNPDSANKALVAAVTRKCGASKMKPKDDVTIISVYL